MVYDGISRDLRAWQALCFTAQPVCSSIDSETKRPTIPLERMETATYWPASSRSPRPGPASSSSSVARRSACARPAGQRADQRGSGAGRAVHRAARAGQPAARGRRRPRPDPGGARPGRGVRRGVCVRQRDDVDDRGRGGPERAAAHLARGAGRAPAPRAGDGAAADAAAERQAARGRGGRQRPGPVRRGGAAAADARPAWRGVRVVAARPAPAGSSRRCRPSRSWRAWSARAARRCRAR
jgi:hypothetical protein